MTNKINELLSLLSANSKDNCDEAYERHTIRELLTKEFLAQNYNYARASSLAFSAYRDRLHILNDAK